MNPFDCPGIYQWIQEISSTSMFNYFTIEYPVNIYTGIGYWFAGRFHAKPFAINVPVTE